MFSKILIANRGEIACRIMRTAHDLGIKTVAVYSDADAKAQHVQMADEAVWLGGSAPAESYLDGWKVLQALYVVVPKQCIRAMAFCRKTRFAELCAEHNLVLLVHRFAIEVMGSKSAAKQAMQATQVPMLPAIMKRTK